MRLFLFIALAFFSGAATLPTRVQDDERVEWKGVADTTPRDVTADKRAFVELELPARPLYEHERFTATLRFGLEPAELARNAVQFFARRLDVPVQVEAPALSELANEHRARAEAKRAGSSFALGAHAEFARRVGERSIGGHSYVVFECERSFDAERVGERKFGAPLLKYARATEFKSDFLSGEVPSSWELVSVSGRASSLVVQPLPREGRPPEFVDAVGKFELDAKVSKEEVEIGERFELTLTLRGDGNLDSLTPPRLRELDRVQVFGTADAMNAGARTLRYDVAVSDARVRSLPSIALAYFDPNEGRYAIARSENVALRVRGGVEPASSGSSEDSGGDSGAGRRTLILPTAAVLVLLLVAARRRRQGRRAESVSSVDERIERTRAAGTALRDASHDADLGPLFDAVVAARLGCAPAAVAGRDLAARLTSVGVSEALALRVARAIEELQAARFGGRKLELTRSELARLADELSAS